MIIYDFDCSDRIKNTIGDCQAFMQYIRKHDVQNDSSARKLIIFCFVFISVLDSESALDFYLHSPVCLKFLFKLFQVNIIQILHQYVRSNCEVLTAKIGEKRATSHRYQHGYYFVNSYSRFQCRPFHLMCRAYCSIEVPLSSLTHDASQEKADI